MKKILAAFALIAIASPSFAGKWDNYVSLRLGYMNGDAEHLGDSLSGIGGSFAFGSNYRSQKWLVLRSEIEFDYHTMTHDGVDISPVGAMVNFYGDFGTKNWMVRPYVGVGFGGKYVNADAGGEDDSSAGIAWDAQGGITFDMSDELKLDAALRYDVVSTLDFTLKTVGVFAGVRWNF